MSFPNFGFIIPELIKNALHSTDAGMVGVSLIFIYLVWMVFMALLRIKQSSHEAHH